MSHTVRLGIFVVAALAVFMAAVFMIGSREFLFRRSYTLKADFSSVGGLTTGSEVRVGGYHQGSVTRIDPPRAPNGSVVVEMHMEPVTKSVLRQDSTAAIGTEGLVGDKYVEISMGSSGSPELSDGSTIQGRTPVEMSALLIKADGLLDTATTAVSSIGQSADNLRTISGKINNGQGTVGALINDKTIYNEAAAGATEFQEDMEALKHNFLLRGFFKKRGYEDADELKQNEIPTLPEGAPMRTFVYDTGSIFKKPEAADLKRGKPLDDVGHFLEQNKFGIAVVTAHTGSKGDSRKDRTLTEAQSMVVRDYLAQNFSFDDKRLKTIGLGKNPSSPSDQIEVLVYPAAPGR